VQTDCMSCNGSEEGCNDCRQTGKWELTQCPLEILTPDVLQTIELAELYEKGLPPVAGGVLDQANIFIESCRFIFRIEAVLKKKLGIIE